MRKDELTAKAARLRERANTLEAQANARAVSPLAEHFPVGVGFGGGRHRPDVHRYAEQMREVSRLRSEAASLEATARRTVFSDDLDGLREKVAVHERNIEAVEAKLKGEQPEDITQILKDIRSSERRKLRAARNRLSAAEAQQNPSGGAT